MRELTINEVKAVEGGFVITTSIVLASIGLATATVYLLNTLIPALVPKSQDSATDS